MQLQCPLPNTGSDKVGVVKCNFRTSKKGMKEGEAARHLSKDHQVKALDIVIARDMNPGQYKFDKIKIPVCSSGGDILVKCNAQSEK